MKKENTSEDLLKYKEKPLVRSENVIYYGNPSDKFIVKMNVKENINNNQNNLSICTNINVQLIDNSKGFYDQKVIKTSTKNSLYLALDIADIWLERALNE